MSYPPLMPAQADPLETAERVFEGRDLASLALLPAGTSLDVHAALLELRDSELD